MMRILIAVLIAAWIVPQARATSLGQVVAPATVDASKMTGSDICVKIQNAFTSLINANTYGGGIVDASGFSRPSSSGYPCSVNPWPALGNATWDTFVTTLILPAALILTDQTWIIPTRQKVKGFWDWWPSMNNGNGGTFLQASNNFPNTGNITPTITIGTSSMTFTSSSNFFEGMWIQFIDNAGDALPTPLLKQDHYHLHFTAGGPTGLSTVANCSGGCTVQLWKYADNTSGAGLITLGGTQSGTHRMVGQAPVFQAGVDVSTSGGLDQFAISVDHLTVVCQTPNNTNPTGAIGILLELAEEQSSFTNLMVRNCNDNAGIWWNAAVRSKIEARNWTVDTTVGLPAITANYRCLVIAPNSTLGQGSSSGNLNTWLDGYNCYINAGAGSSVTVPALTQISGVSQVAVRFGYSELNTTGQVINITDWLNVGGAVGAFSGGSGIILCCGYTNLGGVTATNSVHVSALTGPLQLFGFQSLPGSTKTYTDFSGNCEIPVADDNNITWFSERADGGGITNRQSQWKVQSDCPDFVGGGAGLNKSLICTISTAHATANQTLIFSNGQLTGGSCVN